MYLTGTLEIDPSQITLIKSVKPTKLFGKLLNMLTLGQASEKKEHETFTAVSILQQLNMGIRSVNIINVIRISVDDYDFYLDEKGVEDDLKQAMIELETKIDPLESEIFNNIYLVLEHIDQNLKYLIEINVQRKHKVGEYPIVITVNGMFSDFRMKEGETADNLCQRMKDVFASQESYDEYIRTMQSHFENFITGLEMSIRKYLRVDNVVRQIRNKLIRPKQKIDSNWQIRTNHEAEPVFYGYYGMNDYFFYSWLWANTCFTHNIYMNNVFLVDDIGNNVMSVGDMGFYSGMTNTLNPEAQFEVPAAGDVSYYGNNEYNDYLPEEAIYEDRYDDTDSSNSDWLDSGESKTSGSCGSCSSCSSCSSCGGCGGTD